jgi:hypothetical protein
MKRLVFAALMMVCSMSWAAWELCETSGDGMITYYCDKSTIRKNGAISRMWELRDYSSVETLSSGDRYMSAKVLNVYNCREETNAIISYIFYSGAMGEGNGVFLHTVKESEWKWDPIAPDTIGETKWEIACGKK